jgi:predicted RNA binding protein YcfA (HicA-like mRNA interferase family)
MQRPSATQPKAEASMKAKTRFPSMKAKQLLAILEAKPLGYRVVRQKGSHRRLKAPGRPPITFSFHDKATVSAVGVRRVLTGEAGLSEEEAWELL